MVGHICSRRNNLCCLRTQMPAIYSRAHSASKSCIRTMAVRVIATSGAGSVPPRHILWVCYWQVLHLFIHSTSMSCLDQPVYSQAATVSTLMLYGGCFRTVAWRDGDTASYSLMGREGANSCLQASDKLKNLVLFFFSAPTSGGRYCLERGKCIVAS